MKKILKKSLLTLFLLNLVFIPLKAHALNCLSY